MGDAAWIIAVLVGPLALGGAIAYGIVRNRRLTRREIEAGERGAQRNYDEE